MRGNWEALPPVAAESVVVTAERAMSRESPSSPRVDPGLKPYQPNQRMNVPSTYSKMRERRSFSVQE